MGNKLSSMIDSKSCVYKVMPPLNVIHYPHATVSVLFSPAGDNGGMGDQPEVQLQNIF